MRSIFVMIKCEMGQAYRVARDIVDGIERDTDGVAVLFAADRAELDALLSGPLKHLTTPRAVWIGYPKGNASDINRDSIWKRAAELGWTLNGNISLSETWSSVRIKRDA